VDGGRLEAVRLKSEDLGRRCAEATARALVVGDQARRSRSRREISRESAAAWRRDELSCIPVIEQAKGIVMAQQQCGPVEAFDLLQRASQRTNLRVHVLAAQIVGHLATSNDGGNVTPISLGAIRSPR